MSTITDAWDYLTTWTNWTGANGITTPTFDGGWRFAQDSIIALTLEHLWMSFAAVALAVIVALPLGVYLGHVRKGGSATVVVSNVTRAMPTLALLTLFAASAIGFGNQAVILAAAIFAFPPILTNAFTGMADVDPDIREAALGQGLTRFQVATRVELPLAIPLIAAGLRTATVQTVATVPLAALVAGGGLGVIINRGLATQRYGEVLAGAVLVGTLALLTDAVMSRLQRAVTPAPLREAAASAV
ncbi:ABC transporter permease [Demequina activiva]|uniref:Glycine betaine/carnitine/choline transport system permease protein OpuCB n=1 Tax=Demequina activiva TaxID=1582364 RepID=A0A919Q363_9MICO|nr:ABC transporter permease [Demequina activiva]GIG53463.1 glycine betaine/carnitine/choline transport system permease protein OpuCB [Demequina activiva]